MRLDASPDAAPEPQIVERRKYDRRSVDALRAEVEWVYAAERGKLNGVRGKMKPSRVALLLVALASGGLAAYMAAQNGEANAGVGPQPAVQVVQEARAKVLVATQPIGIGQHLTQDAVSWQEWPEGSVLADYVTFDAETDPIAGLSGSVARSEILPGDPIRSTKLVQASGGYLSAVLDPGKRGVSVAVSAESASGGFISPNDHVDVVLTRTVGGAETTETVLRNVRVLAIDARLGQSGAEDAGTDPANAKPEVFSSQAIATLELEPARAEVVISATALGRLSLVLRSSADIAETATLEHADLDQAIRLSSPFWTGVSQAGLK